MARCRLVRRRFLTLVSALSVGLYLLGSGGPIFSQAVVAPSRPARPPVHRGLGYSATERGRIVKLEREPVHLWQWNPAPGAYYSPMGCGAFTTAMALSIYAPARFGSYAAARALYAQMSQIPLLGGTFEEENAAAARREGFAATAFDHGTAADLMTAIDAGVPVILLVDPALFGLGRHDVLLVGYRVNRAGTLQDVFVDNPAIEGADGADPDSATAPGNQLITMADLRRTWTGVFTPIFRSAADEQGWRTLTQR